MIPRLLFILKRKKYRIYEKTFQLNIIGIRSPETNSDRFDDELHVLFKDDKLKWHHLRYPITTDPGTYWLQNPMQVDGTAILKEGQYENCYKIGLHKGQYKALVQARPVIVIRDYDRNAVLDFYNGKEFTGFFGVTIHRSSAKGSSHKVEKWSAGCQVFQNSLDFNQFLSLCEKHKAKHGNQFTYTLIDLRTVKRTTRRYFVYGTIGLSALGGLAYWYLKNSK